MLGASFDAMFLPYRLPYMCLNRGTCVMSGGSVNGSVEVALGSWYCIYVGGCVVIVGPFNFGRGRAVEDAVVDTLIAATWELTLVPGLAADSELSDFLLLPP